MRTLFPPLLLIVILYVVAFVAVRFFLPTSMHVRTMGMDAVEVGLTLLALLLILILFLKNIIRLRSIRYKVTTQRIFVEHGIFSKRIDEIELEKYKDVFVNQDFYDKIVSCGDIQVITGDVTNPTININDVTDPIGKKEIIRKAARERQLALGLQLRDEM